MNIFDTYYFDDLTAHAKLSRRHRQHRNVHQSLQDACQRLFIAIEPGSYIPPHRHNSAPRDELLVAVRGKMALVTFDDQGSITGHLRFGSEKYGCNIAAAVEVLAGEWHTVIALEPGCILLEVKAGPFDPNVAKDLAPWAPEEDSDKVGPFIEQLMLKIE